MELFELFMYYRKIARRAGWGFVAMNFLKLHHQLETIRYLSDKFGVYPLYEAWIDHHLVGPYERIVSMVTEFDAGRGMNYQTILKKIFGAL